MREVSSRERRPLVSMCQYAIVEKIALQPAQAKLDHRLMIGLDPEAVKIDAKRKAEIFMPVSCLMDVSTWEDEEMLYLLRCHNNGTRQSGSSISLNQE